MDVHTQISLKNYTTMKLGGAARFMTDAHTADDVASLYRHASQQQLAVFVLGGGSNIIARDEGFNGIVIRNRIKGFEVVEDSPSHTTLMIGAGEIWDRVVERTVAMNLSGIEAMSAIPGTAGAAPVQNVGAYGQEIADTLVSLQAYDSQTDSFVTLTANDCGFSYRHSIFRGEQSGRYAITSITIKLYKDTPQPPFYGAVQEYFDRNGITLYTAEEVRRAVISIRTDKLPDPKITPNTGSFFKNAIVEEWQLKDIQAKYPEVPTYDMPDGRYKIPTGWLIEKCGYKGKTLHNMRVHDKNALVLINESATSYADLAAARDEIIGAVRDQFRITIEQEPLEL